MQQSLFAEALTFSQQEYHKNLWTDNLSFLCNPAPLLYWWPQAFTSNIQYVSQVSIWKSIWSLGSWISTVYFSFSSLLPELGIATKGISFVLIQAGKCHSGLKLRFCGECKVKNSVEGREAEQDSNCWHIYTYIFATKNLNAVVKSRRWRK